MTDLRTRRSLRAVPKQKKRSACFGTHLAGIIPHAAQAAPGAAETALGTLGTVREPEYGSTDRATIRIDKDTRKRVYGTTARGGGHSGLFSPLNPLGAPSVKHSREDDLGVFRRHEAKVAKIF